MAVKKVPAVELSECVLCGICHDIAGSVFSISEAGFVSVAELEEYPEYDVNEAIKNCPEKCISWEEQ